MERRVRRRVAGSGAGLERGQLRHVFPVLAGGIKPLVTVTLEALDYSFVMLHAVPGIPDKITLPAFETSQVAKSYVAP